MNEKINMQNLIDSLAEKHKMSREDAEVFVREFFCILEQGLEKDRYVKVKGLGTFKLINVESRESVNVNTGERFQIQGHTKVSFVPDTTLRDVINKPFAHFETVILNEGAVLQDANAEKSEEASDSPFATIEEAFAAEKPAQSLADAIIANELSGAGKKIITAPVAKPQPIIERPVVEEPQEVVEPEVYLVAQEAAPVVEQEEIISEQEADPVEPEVVAPITSVIPPVERKAAPVEEEEFIATPLSAAPHEKWSGKHTWITVMVVVLLACAGVVTYLYFPDIFSSKEEAPQVVRSTEVPQTAIVDSATAAVPVSEEEKADTVAVAAVKPEIAARTEVVPSAASQPTEQAAATAPKVANAPKGYRIEGTQTTHVVAAGETLRTIAEKYYGNRAYSTYIAQYNSDVLKNPDALSLGMQLKIPKFIVKE